MLLMETSPCLINEKLAAAGLPARHHVDEIQEAARSVSGTNASRSEGLFFTSVYWYKIFEGGTLKMRDAIQERLVRDMINKERMTRRLSQKKLAKYSGLKLDEVKNFDNFKLPLNLRLFRGLVRGLGIRVNVVVGGGVNALA